jgi:hypothetical protein
VAVDDEVVNRTLSPAHDLMSPPLEAAATASARRRAEREEAPLTTSPRTFLEVS